MVDYSWEEIESCKWLHVARQYMSGLISYLWPNTPPVRGHLALFGVLCDQFSMLCLAETRAKNFLLNMLRHADLDFKKSVSEILEQQQDVL